MLSCPSCNTKFPIEAALQDEQARKAVVAALKLPAPLGDRILRYLGLFSPKTKTLSWDRATRLLNDLLDCINQSKVTRHGRDWHAPTEYFKDAIDQMLTKRDSLNLPLKDHNYLFEIIANRSNKVEAKIEQKHEEQKQQTSRTNNNEAAVPISKLIEKATEKVTEKRPPPKDFLQHGSRGNNDDN